MSISIRRSRVCLKTALCQLQVTICGRSDPNEEGVAGYADRKRARSSTKWGLQVA